MRRRTVAAALTAALTALVAVAAPAGAGVAPQSTVRCADPAPGKDFAHADPAAAHVDPTALQHLLDWATTRNSLSMRVYRHGCLLGASPLAPATADTPWWWLSAGKGATALAVGRALQLGKLSLSDPVSKYFPEADAAHGKIRLHDLITQTGGLRFSASGDLFNALGTDSVRFALHQKVVHPPGTFFEYQQHGLTLLLACVQRAVGEDVQEFIDSELFSKLGIARNEWFWARDRAGWSIGFGGLFTSPRVMPRLAHLMLNEGTWGGQRLLSRSFVQAAQSATPTNGGYGYLLWNNHGNFYVTSSVPGRQVVHRPLIPSAPRDLFMFVGLGGQYLYIIPSLDMVIERNGEHPSHGKDAFLTEGSRGDGEFNWELFRLLDTTVTDTHWADPGPYRQLDLPPLEPDYIVEPEGTVAGVGVGERAGGCNLVGCDGKPDVTGYQQMQQDLLRYSVHTATSATHR